MGNHKMTKKAKINKGSSTIEYLIVIAAVISVLIVFFRPSGVFQSSVNSVLGSVTSGMEEVGDRIDLVSITATSQSLQGPIPPASGVVAVAAPVTPAGGSAPAP